MKQWIVFASVLLTSIVAQAGSSTKPNVNEQGVMLDGYDAVSYRAPGGPVKGSEKFQAKAGERTYWFASEASKTEFLKSPEKYEPQFDGWCAYAVAAKKEKVEVDPKSFLIQKDEAHPDGRLLLFYNGFLSDTRKSWQHTKDKDEKTYLKEADANWPATKTKEP